jgi:hypothetical protein
MTSLLTAVDEEARAHALVVHIIPAGTGPVRSSSLGWVKLCWTTTRKELDVVDPQLAGWENFYVIVGSSAGALIGLQFVVIALVSSTRARALSVTLRAFATPTIVYFSSVVLTAALLSIPHHTRTSLGSLLLAFGTIGLGYAAWVATHMRKQDSYSPDHGDWLWFVFLPAVAYTGALAAGATVWSAPGTALDVTAGSAMLLLLVGVHNAWDSAIWMVAHPQEDRQE